MVLRVCRRALDNAHDAEDALQATFLLLAQKADSIRKKESLASWLHGVAYRMATDARRAAARRHKHESRAKPTRPPDPALSAAWRELQVLLDEEVARLPEALRQPFVLCCLENHSSAQAAQQLSLEEGTVWKRLSRARKRLQERLTRRGVALPAVLAAAAVGATGASAAVPRSLVGPTVRAAARVLAGQALTGGTVSAKVLTLVKGANQAMVLSRCKAVLLLFLCTALVGTGLGMAVVRGAASAEPPAPPDAAREGAKEGRPLAADAPARAKDKDAVEIGGRVLDADGEPAAAADVALLGEPKSNPPGNINLGGKALARGRADGDGRFRLGVARTVLADCRTAYVIGGKTGHGLAWAPADLKTPSQEALVRLAPEKVVRGRLIDVQGQPAAGVRVRLTGLSESARKDGGGSVFVPALEGFPAWPGLATTDKDGKFTLAGLNPDLGGYVEIDGEEFTVAHAGIQAGKEHQNQEINLTLAPARILEGEVTYKDTGKPVSKARILCLNDGAPAYARTDEKGHYRLRVAPGSGQPGTLSTEVFATPPEGQPYIRREAPFDWPQGAVKHHIDLALERGVLVRGTITDAATGKPIAGAKAMAVRERRLLWDPETPRVTTGDDGTFAVAVPSGSRGHVLVKGPNNDYVTSEITYGELAGGKRFGDRHYADAIIPFEAKAGTETLDVTAKLRRGVTLRGKLLRAGDKPVDNALMVCWNHLDGSGLWEGFPRIGVPVRDGTFELRGCDPEVTYPVHFLDARNKLGATAHLSAQEAAGKEVTVRLEPCGSAVVRFVDKEGKPRKGFRATPFMVFRPGDKGAGADSDFLVNFDTVNYRGARLTADAEGRCTMPVLIPGVTYFFAGYPKPLLTVKSGETLKMDVVIEPQQ
jgi:RNA polymerase sigma factor (sigma-70 family)